MITSQFPLLQYESIIRFSVFVSVLLLMQSWEAAAPFRQRSRPKLTRQLCNMGLLVLGTAALRIVFPLAAVGIAATAEARQWGLFYIVSLADWQTVLASIIILDFMTYVQHRLFHAVPVLWRFHKVHHTDPDMDVTTGLRFHPIEILLSMLAKAAMVIVLGAPVVSVLIFELILNATSMFNHGNVHLPYRLNQWLRLWVVTPNMHLVHHSVLTAETNSNFGFNLPWWDYWLNTYRAEPGLGYQEMTIGLQEHQTDRRVIKLPWLVILPFLNPATGKINRSIDRAADSVF